MVSTYHIGIDSVIYEAEIEMQSWRMGIWTPRGKGVGELGGWN